MGKIGFLVTLLFLLTLSVATRAQERGDGSADGGKREKRVVRDHETWGGYDGEQRSKRLGGKRLKIRLKWNTPENSKKTDRPVRRWPHGETEIGAKLGLNFQELSQSPFSPSFNPGIVGGGYFRRFFGGSGVRVELLGSTASYTSQNPAAYYATHTAGTDTVTKSAFRGIYISIPAMFEQRAFKKLYLLFGPQYSRLISSSDKNGEFTKIYSKSNVFFKSEFSLVGGFEVQLPHALSIGARYVYGLTDVNNNIYPKSYLAWTINSIQATFSYRFY